MSRLVDVRLLDRPQTYMWQQGRPAAHLRIPSTHLRLASSHSRPFGLPHVSHPGTFSGPHDDPDFPDLGNDVAYNRPHLTHPGTIGTYRGTNSDTDVSHLDTYSGPHDDPNITDLGYDGPNNDPEHRWVHHFPHLLPHRHYELQLLSQQHLLLLPDRALRPLPRRLCLWTRLRPLPRRGTWHPHRIRHSCRTGPSASEWCYRVESVRCRGEA